MNTASQVTTLRFRQDGERPPYLDDSETSGLNARSERRREGFVAYGKQDGRHISTVVLIGRPR
jgi:hypothetical protein